MVEEHTRTPVRDTPVGRESPPPPMYPEEESLSLPPTQEDMIVVPDTTLGVPLEGIPADIRAGNTTEHLEDNNIVEDKTVGDTVKRGITVNGKDFMDIMRQKKTTVKLKTTPSGKTTPGRKKLQGSPAPSSVDIRKYMTGNSMKKTFTDVIRPKNTVSDRIEKFQKIVSDSGGGCILGSGMCATHNVKLVRRIDKKKVGENDDSGGVRWVYRDVTSMVCPSANQVCLQSSSEPKPTCSTQGEPSKKKQKIFLMSDNNQSTSEGLVQDENRVPGLVNSDVT